MTTAECPRPCDHLNHCLDFLRSTPRNNVSKITPGSELDFFLIKNMEMWETALLTVLETVLFTTINA